MSLVQLSPLAKPSLIGFAARVQGKDMGIRCLVHPPCKDYECIELFAGQAWVTRSFRLLGHPTASLDINLTPEEPSGMNAWDMTTPAGMA